MKQLNDLCYSCEEQLPLNGHQLQRGSRVKSRSRPNDGLGKSWYHVPSARSFLLCFHQHTPLNMPLVFPLKACCAHHANRISSDSRYHSPVQRIGPSSTASSPPTSPSCRMGRLSIPAQKGAVSGPGQMILQEETFHSRRLKDFEVSIALLGQLWSQISGSQNLTKRGIKDWKR